MPLSNAKAKVTRRDVMEFWARQPFDLQLRGYEGNCDLCFLKSQGALKTIMRERPHLARWWIKHEETSEASKLSGRCFNLNRRYRDLLSEARRSPTFFDDSDEHDVECGLLCAAE